MRDALLDAATELALEHGFDAVGLRQIAERAGASPGMIAYYFGDRDGLYTALFERAFQQVVKQAQALVDPDRAEGASLEEFVRLHVTTLARDPWIPQLIAREVLARKTQLRALFEERSGQGPLHILIGWLEAETARHQLRPDLDPRLTAMSILSLALVPYLFGPLLSVELGFELDDAFRDQLIEHNQQFIAHGIRAHPEPRA